MKLYYTPGACSLGPHIALEWIGKKYESEAVPFAHQRLKDVCPEAAGKVPILDRQDGSALLTQTPAVLRYLADRYPETNIGGGTSLVERSEVDKWLSFLCADLHPLCHPLFVSERYTTETTDDALKAVYEAAANLARAELKVLDSHLEGRNYIVGESPSIVDAYVFPMLGWITIKLPEKLEAYPNLQRLHATLSKNSGVDAALKDEGLK